MSIPFCRHKVIVDLKEKLLLVILDRLLSTYGGEKEIIISCRKIGHRPAQF